MIIRENGIRELYRGLVPILLRNGPSNALFFILREEASKMPQKVRTEEADVLQLNLTSFTFQDSVAYRNMYQFLSGAIIGAFVSSIFYPLNVTKTVIQSKIGGPHENIVKVLRFIYNERGRKVKNVYKGMHMNSIRAFFSWGIMNAAYENLKKFIY